MFTCAICQFAVELDDVALPGPNGLCVCLRCYLRETGQAETMPKELQRAIESCLNEATELK